MPNISKYIKLPYYSSSYIVLIGANKRPGQATYPAFPSCVLLLSAQLRSSSSKPKGWLFRLEEEGSRRAAVNRCGSVQEESQHRPAALVQRCGFWRRTRSVGLWNSKMLNKRLQGSLLLLVVLVTNACGTHAADSEEHSSGKRRLLQTTTPTASGGLFCVAKTGADAAALQKGLNWACGPGHADCTAIQPGAPCYKANNLPALASYAYNDYYHRNANSGATCNFDGTATTTNTDPSSGQCVFAGSSLAGGNSSGTPSANAPSSGFNPPPSFTPGTGGFGNGSSFGSPNSALIPIDGAESFLSGARRALCVLMLLALPLYFGLF